MAPRPSALYPHVLGECLLGRGAVWELLRRQSPICSSSVAVSGTPPTISLMPEFRVKVRADLMPETAKPADLGPAANLVNHYWADFCARLRPGFSAGDFEIVDLRLLRRRTLLRKVN